MPLVFLYKTPTDKTEYNKKSKIQLILHKVIKHRFWILILDIMY